MDLKAAKQTLLEIKEIFDRLNIRFYLSDGTMLGAVRSKSFISGDKDIDLRTPAKEWDFSAFKGFEEKGFRCIKIARPKLYRDKASGFNLFKRGIRVGVGLNYYYPPENLIVYLSGRPLDHATVQSARFYNGDYFTDFLGVKFRIPYPPEEYLEALYNKGWRTPTSWKVMRATRKPISIARYAKYFIEHPEANQGSRSQI